MANLTYEVDSSGSGSSPMLDYQAFEEFWIQTREYATYWGLKTFAPPFLVVLGCSGNAMVLAALRHHCIRSSSIGYYLSLLLACYIVQLVTTCGLEWISYVSNTTLLTNSSDSMCRICQFLYSMINHSPYWIIALMLTDRTVYVCFPIYSSTFCTVFVAKLLTVFLFVGLLTINIHMMWTYELSDYGCSIDPHQRDFYSTIWPWISATVNCYLPLLVIHILILTTSIGVCLSSRQDFAADHRHVSVAIIAALIFVILTNPSVILNLIQYSKRLDSDQSYATLYMLTELFQTLVWLNLSIAHIVYVLAIPKLKSYCHVLCARRAAGTSQPMSIEQDAMIVPQSPSQCTVTAL